MGTNPLGKGWKRGVPSSLYITIAMYKIGILLVFIIGRFAVFSYSIVEIHMYFLHSFKIELTICLGNI